MNIRKTIKHPNYIINVQSESSANVFVWPGGAAAQPGIQAGYNTAAISVPTSTISYLKLLMQTRLNKM